MISQSFVKLVHKCTKRPLKQSLSSAFCNKSAAILISAVDWMNIWISCPFRSEGNKENVNNDWRFSAECSESIGILLLEKLSNCVRRGEHHLHELIRKMITNYFDCLAVRNVVSTVKYKFPHYANVYTEKWWYFPHVKSKLPRFNC